MSGESSIAFFRLMGQTFHTERKGLESGPSGMVCIFNMDCQPKDAMEPLPLMTQKISEY